MRRRCPVCYQSGWVEIIGIADRGDFDLSQHEKHSKKSLKYFDDLTNEKYFPYCIEPSLGVDRAFLAFLCSAYCEEEVTGEKRVLLKLSGEALAGPAGHGIDEQMLSFVAKQIKA